MTKLAKEWELQSDDNARAYRQKVTELQQALAKIAELRERVNCLNAELSQAQWDRDKFESQRDTAIKAVEDVFTELKVKMQIHTTPSRFVESTNWLSIEEKDFTLIEAKYLKPTDIEANLCVSQDTKTRHATLEEVKGIISSSKNFNVNVVRKQLDTGFYTDETLTKYKSKIEVLDELLKAIEGLGK